MDPHSTTANWVAKLQDTTHLIASKLSIDPSAISRFNEEKSGDKSFRCQLVFLNTKQNKPYPVPFSESFHNKKDAKNASAKIAYNFLISNIDELYDISLTSLQTMDSSENYVSRLMELVQSISSEFKLKCPSEELLEYNEKAAPSKLFCGRYTFKNFYSKEVKSMDWSNSCSTKKAAKKLAAELAYNFLVSERSNNYALMTAKSTTIENVVSTVPVIPIMFQNNSNTSISEELPSTAIERAILDRPNYISELHSYFQSRNMSFRYEEEGIHESGICKYRGRFVLMKNFPQVDSYIAMEYSDFHKNKKIAKIEASEKAYLFLNPPSNGNILQSPIILQTTISTASTISEPNALQGLSTGNTFSNQMSLNQFMQVPCQAMNYNDSNNI